MGRSLTINNGVTAEHDVEKLPLQAVQLPSSKPSPSPGLSLEQFRALVGIPQDEGADRNDRKQTYMRDNKTYTTAESALRSISQLNLMSQYAPPIRPATIRMGGVSSGGSRALIFLRLLSRPRFARKSMNRSRENPNAAEEYATSLYFTLLREESDQYRMYHIYNIITYACLILQLVIASALIIIGAIPSTDSVQSDGHRISVAVLGAVTGILTGLLSLLKGQGYPTRLLQYANRLRQVKDKIEFHERMLRANITGVTVTYDDVVDLWEEFETVRNEWIQNRPDVWTTFDALGSGGARFMKTATQGAQAAMNQTQDAGNAYGQKVKLEVNGEHSSSNIPNGVHGATSRLPPSTSN